MNWVTLTLNGTEVSVAFDENSIHIYNAYPIKDDLKLRGYRWNTTDKSWHVSCDNVAAEMEALKNNLQPSTLQAKGVGKTELSKFPESYTVVDLRNRIDQLIREGFRGNIWVRGVIASDVKNYKWASYLDLKDEEKKYNIFFRVEAKKPHLEKINRKLKESGVANFLEKDLPVFCNVDVYLPLRNVVDVRLTLLDILPEYTQAKIKNQREITLEKLKEEGILENQKRLIIPPVISRIGLITSEQGTSIRDIKAGLLPYGDKYRFFFLDSRMEGANAVDTIIQAIDFLENRSEIALDSIIIARGGGSEQSLAVFNNLRLCRKVCLSRIPILTAIGHEKDVSAIELCSWLTPIPSTPSGIGKYLQDRYVNLQEQLSGTVGQLVHHFNNVHYREMGKIRVFLKNIPSQVLSYIGFREERFFSLTRNLEHSVTFTVRDQERRITLFINQLMGKYCDLHLKSKDKIEDFASRILFLVGFMNQRKTKEVEKTILKLDFEKRRQNIGKQLEDIRKKGNNLVAQTLKAIANAQKDLEARRQLAQANNPQNVLKKGFTLTLDKENRAIKSIKEFIQKDRATLKFHDGSTVIKKKLERRKNESEIT